MNEDPFPSIEDFSVVSYATPEEVLVKYSRPPEINGDILALEDILYHDEDEDEGTPASELIQQMIEDGFWGYADNNTRIIHFWADQKTSDEDLIRFFGHEIGHLTKPISDPTNDESTTEENRADTYGQVSLRAFKMLQDFRTKKK